MYSGKLKNALASLPPGNLTNRRLLYEMPSGLAGGPDGAQTDAEGYVWACLSGASQVGTFPRAV